MPTASIDRERALDRLRELTAQWRSKGHVPSFKPHHLVEPVTVPPLGTVAEVKVFFGALLADGLIKPERAGRYKVWRLVEIERGMWRCSACGDASNLFGCAEAIIFGKIDGPEAVTLDDEEQIGLCAGSIECRIHQGTEPLERFDEYRWVRFVVCEDCDGRGMVLDHWYGRGARRACGVCRGRGGWWPSLGQMNPFGAH